jgi:hypothetical protein
MKKAARLLRRFEFHVLLFFLALMAFAKPTLVPTPTAPATTLWLAYFVPWLVLIVVLFAVARSGPQATDEDEFDPDPPAPPSSPRPSQDE